MFDNVYFNDKITLFAHLPFAFIKHFGEIFAYLNKIRASTPQWTIVPLIYLGIKKQIKITLRDNTTVTLTKSNFEKFIGITQSLASAIKDKNKTTSNKKGAKVQLRFSGRIIYVQSSSAAQVTSEFLSNTHKIISKGNVKGKIVLDIGAYMGETAMLYAIWGGARHVYSFEPVADLYHVARNNIALNRLNDRITMINSKLVGAKNKYNTKNSFELSAIKSKEITLTEFVKYKKIKGVVLKLDCEGGEYEIIRDTPSNILRSFKTIHIEYHYGYKDIVKRLKSEGFKVSYTKPGLSIVGLFSGVKYLGDIIATRS